MKKALLVVGACLAVAGCGAPVDEGAEEAISLEGKEDRLGNRHVDQFGGALHFDDQVSYADLPSGGYKVGFTFRATAGAESKVVLRVSGGKATPTLKIYGAKRNGSYPYIGTARVFTENTADGPKQVAVFYLKPRTEGIYLAVASTTRRLGGVAEASLHCGSGEGACELGCAVIRLYDPQCGVDGVTYGNRPSAACYDVPIAHSGECEPAAPSCDDVACGDGSHCELKEVWCITTPCYPQPTCVADENVPSCNTVRCSAGNHCELVDVVCVRAPCYPQPQCRPDVVAPCVRTGCSGQICAKTNMISTCEYRAEYACYQNATCEPQSDGSCGWSHTSTLDACLANPPPL